MEENKYLLIIGGLSALSLLQPLLAFPIAVLAAVELAKHWKKHYSDQKELARQAKAIADLQEQITALKDSNSAIKTNLNSINYVVKGTTR